MSRDRSAAEVEAFVAAYRDAFERRDVDAIVGRFGATVHVVSDTGTGARVDFVSRDAWRAVVEDLVARYDRLDVARAEVRGLETVVVSTHVALARVAWALIDSRGDVVYDFTALYTLTRDGSSWRIVAVAQDEVARSRQHLSRSGPSAGATSAPDAG